MLLIGLCTFRSVFCSDWERDDIASDVLHTTLSPSLYEFEHGHLDHDPFAYHLRVRRRNPNDTAEPMLLTARVFLVTADSADDIDAYMEMDKFSVEIPRGVCGWGIACF